MHTLVLVSLGQDMSNTGRGMHTLVLVSLSQDMSNTGRGMLHPSVSLSSLSQTLNKSPGVHVPRVWGHGYSLSYTTCYCTCLLHSDISLSLYTSWYSMSVTSCTFSSVWTAPVLTSLTWTPALQRSSPDIWCSIYLKLSLETPPMLVRLIGTTRNSGDGCPT